MFIKWAPPPFFYLIPYMHWLTIRLQYQTHLSTCSSVNCDDAKDSNQITVTSTEEKLPCLHWQGVHTTVFYLCSAVLEDLIPVGTRDHIHDDAPLTFFYMYDRAHAITSPTVCPGEWILSYHCTKTRSEISVQEIFMTLTLVK